MAGGIGSRFWPLSKKDLPKQFLDILGVGKTLIQQTYDRFLNICPEQNIYVVTHEDYRSLVQEQLPNLTKDQILTEPFRKNTAPCIAYASYKILEKNQEAVFVVAPADHLVLNTNAFEDTINLALKQAEASNSLVTLGIKPSRPDTGYGYIQFDADTPASENSLVRKVKTFTEKPNLELAQKFIDSGDFYWNSGIFIWSGKSIKEAFEKHLPEMAEAFNVKEKYYTSEEDAFIQTTYQNCKNISVDYGILEKSDNVLVVLSDFGWSDLGTWGSVYMHVTKDQQGNAMVGDHFRVYESNDNMIYTSNPKKMVVLEGMKDFIVVDTEQALLLCRKSEEQKIKQIVNDLKLSKQDSYT